MGLKYPIKTPSNGFLLTNQLTTGMAVQVF